MMRLLLCSNSLSEETVLTTSRLGLYTVTQLVDDNVWVRVRVDRVKVKE